MKNKHTYASDNSIPDKYTLEQIKPPAELTAELAAMYEKSADILSQIAHSAVERVIIEVLRTGLKREPTKEEINDVKVSYSKHEHETCVFYKEILIGSLSFDLVFENLKSSYRVQFRPAEGFLTISTASNT
ncbi:MAG TPA: hypothetical protein VGK59_23780 [Ohtaekwangia sp.]